MAVQYPNMTPEWARWHMQRTMQPQTATPLATPLPAEWSWGSQQAIGPTPSIPAPITDFGAGVSSKGSGMDLPFQNVNYARDTASSDTDLSKAPTPSLAPQPTATPKLTGQQNQQTPNDTTNWYNKVPSWTRGGGYAIGWTHNQDGTYTPGQGLQAGHIIGSEVGWNTPIYLPVAYNPSGDRSAFLMNGKADELGIDKAVRMTADYARTHPGVNAQHFFEYMLSVIATQNRDTGFDASKFVPVREGEQYDPNKTYMAAGVINPWTGKQAGNAQGVYTGGQQQQQPTTPSRGGGTTDAPYTPPGTPPPPPAPGTAPATTPPLPGTGGGTTGGGNPNQTFLDDAAVAWTASHPDEAIQAIRSVRGGKDRSGPMGAYRESSMGQALQAYLSMYGVGGNDAGHNPLVNANQGIQEMIARMNGGQGVGGFLREAAGKMMNGLNYEGLDNSQIMDILGTAGGAGMFGYSPLAQQRMKNELEDMQGRAYDQSRTGVDPTHAILASRQGRGEFDDILARYLAMQQGR